MNSTDEQMREILTPSVIRWAGGKTVAEAWYRNQPIPQLGNLTAQELVNQGNAALVKNYLAQILLGGYA